MMAESKLQIRQGWPNTARPNYVGTLLILMSGVKLGIKDAYERDTLLKKKEKRRAG